ncbi:MAG TPA: tetratricopeptide repeat protein [Sedimentisphaerales bacterium]|nr:tetratricopeptide repeat protein [Sedimentisphaerales bacterium]
MKIVHLLSKQAVETRPSSKWAADAQKRLARMYVQIGDYEKADAAAGKLIESFSNAERIAAAVEDVADKYQLAGSHAKSYPLHRYVVEHWPENERAIWCQMKAIMSQLRLGDLAKAEQELGTLLSDFAGSKELGPAVHEVVEEYRNTGAYKEGRELFAYIMENWDETPDTMLELQVGVALQSIKLREPNRVEAAIEQLIADYNDHPKIAKALFQTAEQYFYAGKHWKVIDILELIQADYPEKHFPAESELPFVLAECYKQVSEWDKAIEYFEKTLKEYPKSDYASWCPYNLAWIYNHQKVDYDKAIYWYEQQMQLYPEDSYAGMALFDMCCLYTHTLKDYPRGARLCQQYVDERPGGIDEWGCLSNLARCHEHLGNTEKAIEVLSLAYEKAKTSGLRKAALRRIEELTEGGVK